MKLIISLFILCALSFESFSQTDRELKMMSKNQIKADKARLRSARHFAENVTELRTLTKNNLKFDSVNTYFKYDIVLTQCSAELLCNKLFSDGKLTGEMFYKEIDKDPIKAKKSDWTSGFLDTLNNPLWNNGNGTITILNFMHIEKLDKEDRKVFYVFTSFETHFTSGCLMYFLVLEGNNSDKNIELQHFIDTATKYQLKFASTEI